MNLLLLILLTFAGCIWATTPVGVIDYSNSGLIPSQKYPSGECRLSLNKTLVYGNMQGDNDIKAIIKLCTAFPRLLTTNNTLIKLIDANETEDARKSAFRYAFKSFYSTLEHYHLLEFAAIGSSYRSISYEQRREQVGTLLMGASYFLDQSSTIRIKQSHKFGGLDSRHGFVVFVSNCVSYMARTVATQIMVKGPEALRFLRTRNATFISECSKSLSWGRFTRLAVKYEEPFATARLLNRRLHKS